MGLGHRYVGADMCKKYEKHKQESCKEFCGWYYGHYVSD